MADGSATDEDIIGECIGVLEAGEDLVTGWILVAINKYDLEELRVVLLSSAALYRVKYKFSSHALIHHERTPLSSIIRIQVGPLYHTGLFSPSGQQPSPSHSQPPPGIRIFSTGNTHRTFRPRIAHLPPLDAREIADAIMDAREAAVGSRGVLDLFDIPRSAPLGPLSALANRFKSNNG